jgi:hypothetical protein
VHADKTAAGTEWQTMNSVDQALQTVKTWLRELLAFLFRVFTAIEGFLHATMTQAGIPGGVQSLVILVVAILFIVAVLRLFGGIIRLLLVLFLILLLLHVLVPNLGI